MEQIEKFFDAYAEGDLTDDQSRELCRCLRSSDAAVDWFVRECFLHWQLFALLQQRLLHAGVMETPTCDGAALLESTAASSDLPGPLRSHAAVRRVDRRALLALAASLVAAVAGLVWNFSRPKTVGQLSQATANATWSVPAEAPGVGALLIAGQELRLARGRVQVTLVSGTKVVIEGPSVIRAIAENEIWIESGRIAATVPPQATGFVVGSAVGRFVDLGTEFTLDFQPGRSARLYVFAGLVDVQPNKGPSFKVPQSIAKEYDAASGKVTPLKFGDEQRLSF